MFSGDTARFLHVGDGTRHLEYAMVGPRREAKVANCLLQQFSTMFIGRAQRIDFSHGE